MGPAEIQQTTHPSSWWFWPAAVLNHDTTPNQESVAEEVLPAPAPGPPQDPTEIVAKLHQPQEATTSAPSTPLSLPPNTVTWSSWLGSYISGPPASTTIVTYGLGIAPITRPPSAAGSTAATSVTSTVAPEADETFPDPHTEGSEHAVSPAATLHPRNLILNAVPVSRWSSFLTGRNFYPQSRIKVTASGDSGGSKHTGAESASEDPSAPMLSSTAVSRSTSEMLGAAMPNVATAANIARPSESIAKGVEISETSSSMPLLNTSIAASPLSTSNALISIQPSIPMSSNASSASTDDGVSHNKQNKAAPMDKKVSQERDTTGNSKPNPAQRPQKPTRSNLILPSFEDTFYSLPRSLPIPKSPDPSPASLKKVAARSFGWIFSASSSTKEEPTHSIPPVMEATLKEKVREIVGEKSQRLPKALSVAGEKQDLGKAGRICVIGVHGWFMQSYLSMRPK